MEILFSRFFYSTQKFKIKKKIFKFDISIEEKVIAILTILGYQISLFFINNFLKCFFIF